jgi:transglutaminase-like putative cysteine protease
LITVNRPAVTLAELRETPRVQTPAGAIAHLMPSRYCQSDLFLNFVSDQFYGLTGGPLVQAIADWIRLRFTYDNSVSNSGTTATDSFAMMAGVCRDYAHVMIAMVRAGGIPARFVSVYAPDVVPQDFHAVVEVFLDGGWHLVDPTGMATPQEMIRISAGRDAANASFMTSYGWMTLRDQSVTVTRC